MRGTLAFDIDGTITQDKTSLPEVVAKQLKVWSEQWHIVLITGRPFSYAKQPLEGLDFEFVLGVQNGADIVSMPDGKRIGKNYVGSSILEKLEAIYKNFDESFFVYRGFEAGDSCYYRPHLHSPKFLDYVEQVTKKTGLPWTPIKELDEITETSFPLIKCVGPREKLHNIAKALEGEHSLNLAQVADPIFPEYDLLLINDKKASKGQALLWLLEQKLSQRPLIVAGDDNNDIPMMEIADFALGMNGGSEKVKEYATIMADFDQGQGLIKGIEEGIKYVSQYKS